MANVGSGADAYAAGLAGGWKPDPTLTVTECAERYRILSSKESPEPGPYRSSRTPYVREPMDCLSAHSPVRRVVLQWGTQLSKTEIILNWILYTILFSPGPMLMVQPTVNMAKRVSKQRLATMIESTPALRNLVKEARSRDSGNTMFEKEFPGGILILTGANSAASLASMPMRNLAMDEVDRWPEDVDEEGNPIAITEERSSNFARGKTLITSTPTVRGASAVETEFLLTDQRRYFVPCPRCCHMDYIQWRLGGRSGDDGRHHFLAWIEKRPETAYLVCAKCDRDIQESSKTEMLDAGEWRPTAAGDGISRGYHLSSMYSPIGWKSWASLARRWVKAKGNKKSQKTVVNTVLAETWEEEFETLSSKGLLGRVRAYGAEVPVGVILLTAALDVQKDRLEVVVKGWGAGEESWLIDYWQELGDPENDDVWFKIWEALQHRYTRADGSELGIKTFAVDTNYCSDQAYKFVRAHYTQGARAVRGGNVKGLPVVSPPSRRNAYHLPLWTLCTHAAKDTIFARLAAQEPGPGYMHFPDWAEQEYFDQLTAEVLVKKMSGGRMLSEYVKVRDRNEALDLEVYNLGALYILGPARLRQLGIRSSSPKDADGNDGTGGAAAAPVGSPPPPPPVTPPPAAAPPGYPGVPARGWINSWKK